MNQQNNNDNNVPITVDVSLFPIIKCHYNRNCSSDKEYKKLEQILVKIFDTYNNFSLIFACNSNNVTPDMEYIIKFVNMLKNLKDRIKNQVIGTAIIVENILFQMVVKFGLMIYPAQRPVKTFDSEEEAIDWLEDLGR